MASKWRLRSLVPYEELDYVTLKNALSHYSKVRAKISSLLKSGELIRVKKGLYVFGASESKGPYSKEILANLIYGPSYLSLDYALSLYGIIPERVEMLTCVSCKKDKYFETPVGRFSYRYLNIKKYPLGVTQMTLDDHRFFLIATPEKALADKIVLDSPQLVIKSQKNIQDYLWKDLRCDEARIRALNLVDLQQIADTYHKENLNKILLYLKKVQS